MHNTAALKPGTYKVKNGNTYTVQVWEVTAASVTAYTVPVPGLYPAEFLRTMTHAEAAEILAALCSAVLEFTPAPAPIGKQAARTLHLDLARLGFRDHYGTASEALGVPVSSLAQLTAAESAAVRSYAHGQWGMV